MEPLVDGLVRTGETSFEQSPFGVQLVQGMDRPRRVDPELCDHLVRGEWSVCFGVSCDSARDIILIQIVPERSSGQFLLDLRDGVRVQ